MKRKNLRVMLGFREIAGYYGNLKQGLDALGVDCVFLNLAYHPFKFSSQGNPPWANQVNDFFQRLSRHLQKGVLKALWMAVLCPILSFPLFLFSLWRFDVFVFSTLSSFCLFLELPILRLLGKQVIYVYHGSESRPYFMNGYHFRSSDRSSLVVCFAVSLMQKVSLWWIDRFATQIISIPPQAYFNTRRIVNGYYIGLPYGGSERIREFQKAARPDKSLEEPVTVLHAPSKPGPKGTPRIREVIAQLRDKGYAIDYVEIVGRPNHEVIAAIASCDMVIDEIHSDTPMAGFAAEAASLGKPALVGGYYAKEIGKMLPSSDTPPTYFCHPDELFAACEKMVSDHEFRRDLGRKAREFLDTSWSVDAVAKRYLALFQDEYPANWDYDPYTLDYVYGCGFSESDARKYLSAYVGFFGSWALFLWDKTPLQKAITSFCVERSTAVLAPKKV